MNPDRDSQRREARSLRDERIHIQVQHGAEGGYAEGYVLHAHTHDISAGGINAFCAYALDVATVLDLLVEFPGEPPYLLTAEVRWCSADEAGFRIGFQILANRGSDYTLWCQRQQRGPR
jgi:hypothetical protein